MKLELKHLAPYLPYGLKCEILNYQNDYVNEKYGTCNGYYISGGLTYYTFKSRDVAGKTNDLIKPILRPLSDLTKEVDCIGQIFVPIDRINAEAKGFGLSYYIDDSFEKVALMMKQSKNIHINYFGIPYEVNEMLFEWHFDVFNLIPEGLAIDINTLTENKEEDCEGFESFPEATGGPCMWCEKIESEH